MTNLSFKLDGEMPSKKNQWKHGAGGQVYIPKDTMSQIDDFLWQIRNIRTRQFITGSIEEKRLRVSVQFYSDEEKDLDNKYTTLQDILQKSGLIKNDKQIKSFEVDSFPTMTGKSFINVNIQAI